MVIFFAKKKKIKRRLKLMHIFSIARRDIYVHVCKHISPVADCKWGASFY